MFRNPFELLEIAPTSDKKAIKKAYAKMVKRYHPEEFPQEWKCIHDAYEAAILRADTFEENEGKKEQTPPVPIEISGNTRLIIKQPEPKENPDDFALWENLDELAAESRRKEHESNMQSLQRALLELERLGDGSDHDLKEWEELFAKEDYAWAIRQDEFIIKWADVLRDKRIDEKWHSFMKQHLEEITQPDVFTQQEKAKKGLLSADAYVRIRIDGAYRRYEDRRRKQRKQRNWGIVAGLLMISLLGMMQRENSGSYQTHWQGEKQISDEGASQEETWDWERQMIEYNKSSVAEGLLTLMKNMDDEHKQEWIEKSVKINEGIYLLDAHDVAESVNVDYAQKQEENFSFCEVPAPKEISVMEGRSVSDKEVYAFCIYASKEHADMILGCDFSKLGFEGEYRVYYYDDKQYVEVVPENEFSDETMDGQYCKKRFEIAGCQMFTVDVPQEMNRDENYPIVVIVGH